MPNCASFNQFAADRNAIQIDVFPFAVYILYVYAYSFGGGCSRRFIRTALFWHGAQKDVPPHKCQPIRMTQEMMLFVRSINTYRPYQEKKQLLIMNKLLFFHRIHTYLI